MSALHTTTVAGRQGLRPAVSPVLALLSSTRLLDQVLECFRLLRGSRRTDLACVQSGEVLVGQLPWMEKLRRPVTTPRQPAERSQDYAATQST